MQAAIGQLKQSGLTILLIENKLDHGDAFQTASSSWRGAGESPTANYRGCETIRR